MKSPWVLLLPLYLAVTTAIGYVDYRARPHLERGFTAYSQGVVANTEDPPGKYRVLGPFVFEQAVALTGADRRVVWAAFRWLAILAALLATHALLRGWFTHGESLLGASLSAVWLLLTFTNSWPHPDHLVEWALTAAAVGALARGRDGWFAAWLLLAALNRETSAFLVVLYLAARPLTRAHLVRGAGLGAMWVLVYSALRFWRGVSWYDPWQFSRNLEFLGLLPDSFDPYARAYAWFGVALLAPPLWLVWRTWLIQPRLLRAAAAVVTPLFVVTAFLFSSIVETRIFTPLIPMLVGGVMFALLRSDTLR